MTLPERFSTDETKSADARRPREGDGRRERTRKRVLEAAFELSHEFNTAVHATVARMPTSAERTNAAMRYYLERAKRDPKWGWAMVHISATGPLFGAETYEGSLLAVEAGIASGEFKLANAKLGRALILGTALAAWRLTHGRGSPGPSRWSEGAVDG